MKLTSKQLLALRRLYGENKLNITKLTKELNVSRGTLSKALNNDDANLKQTTVTKINNWIIDQYTPIKVSR